MVGSVAGDLPEQVKNNQSVNLAAGNGGQKMSQYSWFTVYYQKGITPHTKSRKVRYLCGFPAPCLLFDLQTDGKRYKQRLAYLQGF